jgi:hypothetical protein
MAATLHVYLALDYVALSLYHTSILSGLITSDQLSIPVLPQISKINTLKSSSSPERIYYLHMQVSVQKGNRGRTKIMHEVCRISYKVAH